MADLTTENVEYLIVHCAATTPSMDIGVREIDRWHRQKGWMSCGYHTVIRRDGTVEQGRSLPKPGAHCLGYNHCSIGICLVGGINEKGEAEDNFTHEQFQSLRWVLDALTSEFHKAVVRGHRDMPGVNKACPSFPVMEWYHDGKP